MCQMAVLWSMVRAGECSRVVLTACARKLTKKEKREGCKGEGEDAIEERAVAPWQ